MSKAVGILLGLSLALASCGKLEEKFGRKDGGFTQVTFSRQDGELGTLATLDNGIMIYAYSPDFATNIKITDETSPASLSLPNGDYSFYAFGLTEAYGTYDPALKCAVAGHGAPLSLRGGATSVGLTFNTSNCSSGGFTSDGNRPGYTSDTIFPDVAFFFCGTSANLSTKTSTSSSCGSGQGWNLSNAFKIKFPLYAKGPQSFNRLGSGIESGCIGANTSGNAVTGFYRMPAGPDSKPFLYPVEFETYSETSCTSSPLKIHRFHRGVAFGPDPDPAAEARAQYHGSSLYKFYLFLRE